MRPARRRPDYLPRRLIRLAKEAGVRPIRFHDLRHTYATIALEAGEHPKVVSERLGHSTVAITLDTYSHVAHALASEAATRIASTIFDQPAEVPEAEPKDDVASATRR